MTQALSDRADGGAEVSKTIARKLALGTQGESGKTATQGSDDATQAPASADTLNVFISYSRADMTIADAMVEALERNGFSVTIDRRDLPYGEEWQKELANFIATSDTVVWLVSPDSVKSKWCNWELGEVGRLSKRLVPVKVREIDPNELPEALGRIHLLPAEGAYDAGEHEAKLVAALNTDRAWHIAATKLGETAREWMQNGRDKGGLLRGAAEAAAEAERERAVAVSNEDKAREQEKIANEQRDAAIKNETVSLAALSRVAASENRPVYAVKLALAAWPRAGDAQRPQSRRTMDSLATAFPRFGERLLLVGHEKGVGSVAYSPDGELIVTASPDSTARVWNALTGAKGLVLRGHEGVVASAVFAPHGGNILTAGEDKTARVWSTLTGTQLMVLTGHTDKVLSAAYSSDGERIVTASWDDTVRIWNVRTGEQLKAFERKRASFQSAAFSPDGTRILVTMMFNKTAQVWDATTGATLLELSGHKDFVSSAAFSADGARIVTGSGDDTAIIWDAQIGSQLHVLSGHTAGVSSASFSPDGSLVITSSADGTARVWSSRKFGETWGGSQLSVLEGHEDAVWQAQFSPDGKRVITGSRDKTARLWNVVPATQVATFDNDHDLIDSAAFSPDGKRVVMGSVLAAKVWDVASGRLMVLDCPGDIVSTAIFSPDGSRILTGGSQATTRIWDAKTGEQILTLDDRRVEAASFSPDGMRILTRSGDGPHVRNALSGALLLELATDGHTTDVGFSPDGRRVVTSSANGVAHVWDAATGVQLMVLTGHKDRVTSAAFSRDGTQIVTASADKTVRIWSAESGAQLVAIAGDGEFRSAAFSPDGSRIVATRRNRAVSYIGTSWLLDTATGARLLELDGFGIGATAFTADGNHIITADEHKARIWDISSLEKGGAFEVACQWLGNDTSLTDVQERYGLGELTPICGDNPPLPVDWSKLQ